MTRFCQEQESIEGCAGLKDSRRYLPGSNSAAPVFRPGTATSQHPRQTVKVDGTQERLHRIRVQVTINDGRWRAGVHFRTSRSGNDN
jgi:hypothetical protein